MNDYQSCVYVWGSTAHGALGHLEGKAASKKVQPVPRRLTSPQNPNSILIGGGSAIRVAAGNGFSTCLTDGWEAYSWGRVDADTGGVYARKNDRGGSKAGLAGSGMLRKVQLENVANIAHGSAHTCAVTLDGEVYGWGANAHGNLGCDSSNDRNNSKSAKCYGRRRIIASSTSNTGNGESRRKFVSRPRKMDVGDDAAASSSIVACGEKHTCILRSDGTLLTLGANDAGQLGIGSSHHNRKEKNVEFHRPIQGAGRGPMLPSCVRFKEISCGNNHSAAISLRDGDVYTWGWGMNGRLGHGGVAPRDHPTRVEALSGLAPFAAVSCGSAHTLVATEDGDAYGFGWNAHGQVIGTNENRYNGEEGTTSFSSEDCLLPVPCLKKKGVVKLSCSGFHSAAITLAGDLYMWGMNEDGQCGAGHELSITYPSKVKFQDAESIRHVVSVACGHSHTVCILSNYLPLESEDMINRIQKCPLSADIIIRFARYAIFRSRLLRLLAGANTTAIRIPEIAASKDSPPEVELQLEESSSLSSHSSWSDDPCDLNTEEAKPNNDEIFHRMVEMQKMSDEDHRSSAHMSHLRSLRQRAIQAENLAIQKERADRELKMMSAEDVISKKLRAHTMSQKELKRSTKRKNKATNARDARTNDQINKAANRLTLARERRKLANAQKVLPKVQRKPTEKKARKKCAVLDGIVDNKQQISAAEQLRRARRRKLVRRRETRLQSQEKIEKEKALAKERAMKEKLIMDRLEKQRTRQKMEEERKRVERERKSKLLKKSAELRCLEDELKLNKRMNKLRVNDFNKENNNGTNFRDLKHWTKSLSGVM